MFGRRYVQDINIPLISKGPNSYIQGDEFLCTLLLDLMYFADWTGLVCVGIVNYS